MGVYLVATEIRDAIDQAERLLLADCYKPVNIRTAWEIDFEDWESEDDEYPSRGEVEALLSDGGYLYSAFHGWGREDKPTLTIVPP